MEENDALDLLESFMELHPNLNSLNNIGNKFNKENSDIGFTTKHLLGILVNIRESVKEVQTKYETSPKYYLIKKGYMKSEETKNTVIIKGDNLGNIGQSSSGKIHFATPKPKKPRSNTIKTLVIGIAITVIGGYILHKLGWV
jgi:hypothetical protein